MVGNRGAVQMTTTIWHIVVTDSSVSDVHTLLRERSLFCSLCTSPNRLLADQTVSVPDGVLNEDLLN